MNQRASFEEIVEQNKGLLYKVVNIYGHNEDDRNDLLQEIKIQLGRSYERYNDEYKLSTWIYRVALNVAISFYRKKKTRSPFSVPIGENETFAAPIENREQDMKLILLDRFIGELQELDRALMVLYLDEKSHTEIAEILGISASNVSTKIGRIKVRLKERFIAEGY